MSARGDETMGGTYAEALAEAADAKGQLAAAGEEILAFASVWRARKDVRAYFLSGAIHRDAKHKAIETTFRGRGSDLFADFLHVLLRRGRMSLLPDAADAFGAILDRKMNRVPVTLSTAATLAPGQLESITARLRASLGKDPIVAHVVRPALLGGAVLRVGDIVADGSVRRMLAELRARITHAGDLKVLSKSV